jgi:hypothetical protein
MTDGPRDLVIPAGHARRWRMRAGERATISQTEGHQVGDFIAFNAADLTEFPEPEPHPSLPRRVADRQGGLSLPLQPRPRGGAGGTRAPAGAEPTRGAEPRGGRNALCAAYVLAGRAVPAALHRSHPLRKGGPSRQESTKSPPRTCNPVALRAFGAWFVARASDGSRSSRAPDIRGDHHDSLETVSSVATMGEARIHRSHFAPFM